MVDVLIPTCNRPAALAVTLSFLASQQFRDFSVLIADQSDAPVAGDGVFQAVRRVARHGGLKVEVVRNVPRRGLAQQRQFLLDRARQPYCLFLDDDVILEPWVVKNLHKAIKEERCGFVGQAVIGLSFLADNRPHERKVEIWRGKIKPEKVRPGGRKWLRYKLHNAANLYHAAREAGAYPDRPKKYKVAWVGGCVIYDTGKLVKSGGFNFWRNLPSDHCGEDVLAQLKVMEKYGGCGLMPSGAYHQELATTVLRRDVNAPEHLQGLLA